ncbi:hypothetical protein OG900_12350 [Streptomyces sp. NBC_00433]
MNPEPADPEPANAAAGAAKLAAAPPRPADAEPADAETATRAVAPGKATRAESGIEPGDSLKRSDGTTRFEGTSPTQTGVTVWMESEGPYVAVLFVTARGNPESQFLDTGVEKCIAASLSRPAPGAPAATEKAPPPPGYGSGGTGKAGSQGATADRGDVHSTDSC